MVWLNLLGIVTGAFLAGSTAMRMCLQGSRVFLEIACTVGVFSVVINGAVVAHKLGLI